MYSLQNKNQKPSKDKLINICGHILLTIHKISSLMKTLCGLDYFHFERIPEYELVAEES